MEEQTYYGHAKSVKKPALPLFKILAGLTLILLVAFGSFAAGIQYQKSHTRVTTAGSANTGRFSVGFGGPGRNAALGAVTAISSSSISVEDQRAGTTTTFAISSSTAIENNGVAASYSDIKVGDTVIVSADSNSSSTASRIVINPAIGGPGSFDSQSGQSSSVQSDTVTN